MSDWAFSIDHSVESAVDWIELNVLALVVVSCCCSVASQRLVSPGAATDGVTLFFLEKKLTTFFSHHPLESDDLFYLSSPHHTHLPTSFVFVNSATKIHFIRVSPWMVSPGAVRPLPLVTPLLLLWLLLWLSCLFLFSAVYSSYRLHRKGQCPQLVEDSLPGVSILKPLTGVDPNLFANLETFFNIKYPTVSICTRTRWYFDCYIERKFRRCSAAYRLTLLTFTLTLTLNYTNPKAVVTQKFCKHFGVLFYMQPRLKQK